MHSTQMNPIKLTPGVKLKNAEETEKEGDERQHNQIELKGNEKQPK